MHLRCPHCQNPIELADLPSGGEITCAGCGSTFQLDKYATATYTPPANKRLGKFEVLSTVGQGAFGTVLKARDTELDRTVAIKVPRAGNVGPTQDDVDRFLREARSVAQLRFPSIISIHEVGADNGVPYLVCDFVEGVTLADYLSGRGFSFKESAKLLAEVADALQYAHSLGVVHRDVKPSNIMIRPDGSPCVMDFGLAKRDAGEITMTIDGQILGTPAYMSPEQARGESHKVDGRSDVYSLGVILYQLLTSELPFRGNKAMLLHQVLHEEPQRPRALNDKIPRDLETIALKAMAKEPGRRFGSAKEMAEDLRRWLAGEPILARPVGPGERLWRWCKRKPALAVANAAVLAALAIFVAAFFIVSNSLSEEQTQRRKAEQQTRERALAQVNGLRGAAPGAVPAILAELEANGDTVLPQLRERFAQEKDRPKRMRLALALVSVEPAALRDELAAWMLQVDDPAEVLLIRDALAPHKAELVDRLWAAVETPDKERVSQRLPAAAALATYDAQSPRWDQARGKVVEDLVAVNPLFLGPWSEAFRPVRLRLLRPLSEIFRDQRPERSAERKLATSLLIDYAADQPPVLADLLMDADEKQFAAIFPKFKEQSERGLPILSTEMEKKPVIVKDKIVKEVKGKIAEGDAKVKLIQGLAMPAKGFEVRLQAGKQYRLTMDSKELDSVLVLQDKTGRELAYDDDSGGDLNALIVYTPSSDDTYTVFAAALQNEEETKNSGAFVLKIIEMANPDENKEKLAKRQANAAVALLRMKQEEKVWPLLKRSTEPDDPRVRSYLIHRFGPLGADVKTIAKRLDEEPDITIRRALILSLGEYGEMDLSADDRGVLTKKMQEAYATAADPGLHAASEWLLRHWKHGAWLKQTDNEWANDGEQREERLKEIKRAVAKESRAASAPGAPPQWYVNGQGQTMVVIPGPVEFVMGSPPTEMYRRDDENQHKKRIGRTFAIASKSVTMEQYQKFDKGYSVSQTIYKRMADLPVVGTKWNQAAAYCNWLSEKEGIDKKEWCYEIKGQVTKLRANYWRLSGYRLPTEAEMEYATRAGAVTSRYFGETEELLPKYAWYEKNSHRQTWPVGSLKPNDLGLFDVHGNAFTWCQDWFLPYPVQKGEEVYDDEGQKKVGTNIVLRGGSTLDTVSVMRSANRGNNVPTSRSGSIGFRVARTLALAGFAALPPDRLSKPVATILLEKMESLTDKDSGWIPVNPKADRLLKLVSGNPHKVYTLKLTKGDKLVIRLKSKDMKFDPVVALEDSKKNIIAYNDDEDDEILDSKLVVTIPADGEYRIIATCSHEDIPNKYGPFHLTVEKTK